MDFATFFNEYILHLDQYLAQLVDSAGIFSYLLIFFIVFAETGFIVTVFLPSDTVLFAACALASLNGSLSFPVLVPMFFVAAALGDSLNFAIGRTLRKKIKTGKKIKFIKQESIEKTERFYQKNGNVTVVVARFIPILRSCAPFVAGISKHSYRWFLKNNLAGVAIWTVIYSSLGYFFSNIPIVQENFGLVVFGITFLILLTTLISLVIHRVFFPKIK